ncbi:hypothetical protein EAF04_001352 [Stromatinia cepivora]|nr:hypothetical protein EAF04_001352 [Stromatinia cepivora]
MGQRTTAVTTSDNSNPFETNVPHGTMMTVSSTTMNEIGEKCEFKILSEILPGSFEISGGCQATLEGLETTLAGTVLLAEYDGRYRRILTWLWRYGLSRRIFSAFQIEADGPDGNQLGTTFLISAYSFSIRVHKSVLEKKWSGRLLIARWTQQRWILVEYLWKDIREGFAGLTNRRIWH